MSSNLVARRQLTEEEIKILQSYKGQEDGANKFFAKLSEFYKDDEVILAEIRRCKSMRDSLDFLLSWSSHQKSERMFFEWMDELLKVVGYRKA